jgi:hypothetical protein
MRRRLLNWQRRLGPALAIATVPLVLSCAGVSQAQTSTVKDTHANEIAFANCMRQQGIPVEDPDSSGHFKISANPSSGPQYDMSKVQAVEQTCQKKVGWSLTVDVSQQQTGQFMENALKYASCMRQHGINWPDPQPGQNGTVATRPPAGYDPNAPQSRTAQQACQRLLNIDGQAPPGS